MVFLVWTVGIPVHNEGVGRGDTVLHAACRYGQTEGVRVGLELEAPVEWRTRRYLSGAGEEGKVTALGEAALSGALGCVRLLLARSGEDGSEPEAGVLAGAQGHLDVLRALEGRCPCVEGEGEGLSLGVCFGHLECGRRLKGRRFSWSPRVVAVLKRLRIEGLEELSRWFVRSRCGSETGKGGEGGEGGEECGVRVSVWEGVRWMVVKEGAPWELLEVYGERLGEKWIGDAERSDEEFVARLRGLGLPERLLDGKRKRGARPGRSVGLLRSWELGLVMLVVRDVSQLGVDLYEHVSASDWGRLFDARVPLRWEEYEDGAEYLPALAKMRSEGVCLALAVLTGRGGDVSRHHFCTGLAWSPGAGPCGYQKAGGESGQLTVAGATPCACDRRGRLGVMRAATARPGRPAATAATAERMVPGSGGREGPGGVEAVGEE
jgi:hypothetical protein